MGRYLIAIPDPRDRRVFRVSASANQLLPGDAGRGRDHPRLPHTAEHGMHAATTRNLQVTVPTWRVDVNDPVVLIEDVARMVGYDQIPVAPQPSMPSVGLRVTTDRLRQVVSEHLVSAGFYECRNPSLESPKMSAWLGDASDSITLGNWATREMSLLRRTLLSGLAATVQTNIRRGAQAVWFFEVDRLFGRGGAEPDGTACDAQAGGTSPESPGAGSSAPTGGRT